jgi:hypothetical protein
MKLKPAVTLLSIMVITLAFSQTVYKTGDNARLAPRLLNYQGYLTDTLGNPVTNPAISMSFAIFDAVSGGNQKWGETQPTVSVDKGIFNVLLGSVAPIPDSVFTNSNSRYLELTVAGQVLSPRTRIVSAAYSYVSTYSDTALYARNVAADNDWSFRVTDGADTTLQMGGPWGLARAGNVLYGDADSTHVNLGVACTTGTVGENFKYCTIGGGVSNLASWLGSTVAGGERNIANGYYSTISGGNWNVTNGNNATIAGGEMNTAGACACIGGGSGNNANDKSVIAGGSYNTAGQFSAIVGGSSNLTGDGAFIGGGNTNTASGDNSAVCSGSANIAGGNMAVICGGAENHADSNLTFIGSGEYNIATGSHATITGGVGNTASGDCASVSGGAYNRADSSCAFVGGGGQNYALNHFATVTGGSENIADGQYSTVGGGQRNFATGIAAIVSGGSRNWAIGDYSAILGGYADTISATGYYSYLFGINSNLTQDSTFMVDMPHVRFGKESNGYEFPISDGNPGQVMVTNGAGQMSWSFAPSASNNWYLRITDGADTTLETMGRWGLARNGSVSQGNSDSTHVNFGVACTTGSQKYATVGGGYANTAKGLGSAVSGGWQNHSNADASFIGGGSANAATNSGTVVAGGYNNTASYFGAMVGGGWSNQAGGDGAAVCGGAVDSAKGSYSFIGGGAYNKANGSVSVVSGGWLNSALDFYGFVGGGYGNVAQSFACGVLSGYGNHAGNDVTDTCAVVSGGNGNYAIAKYSFVGGGWTDTASGQCAVVAGGWSNLADDYCSTVGGGENNFASGNGSAVSGGGHNLAGGSYSTVAGGVYDTSTAAYSFTAGYRSVVPSGYNNSVAFNGYAATASGQTRVGILAKASGSFTIDHPLDPENKILNHYFVESPDMSNIYEGEAVLDGSGRAEVTLPVYFDALNRAPRIQLTGVGTSDVYVAEKVKGNRFVIGGKPGTEVYWMVTGNRKDQSAEITKVLMPVEQPKTGGLAGRSLDDEFLVSTMAQLERMGKAGGFKFRHASEQKRYEEMRKLTENKNIGAKK